MRIKNNEDAIKLIIDTSILHAEASSNGNYKEANKNFDLRESSSIFNR
jgi:hypothetical protein